MDTAPEGGASRPASPQPPSPAGVPTRPPRTARWVNVALVVAVAVAVAGVAFAIGRATAPSGLAGTAPGSGQVFVGPGGIGSPGQGNQGGRFPLIGAGGLAIEGTVESIDGDSLTIRTTDGSSITLSLDGETSYHTAADADPSAVTSGSQVVVRVQPGRVGPGASGSDTIDLGADDVTVVR
jgi:hypothetical protein